MRFTAQAASGLGRSPESATWGSVESANQSEQLDEMVVAQNQDKAVAGYPYFIETTDGRSLFGYTDESGHLPRVATPVGNSYIVYWGDEALAMHIGDVDA